MPIMLAKELFRGLSAFSQADAVLFSLIVFNQHSLVLPDWQSQYKSSALGMKRCRLQPVLKPEIHDNHT